MKFSFKCFDELFLKNAMKVLCNDRYIDEKFIVYSDDERAFRFKISIRYEEHDEEVSLYMRYMDLPYNISFRIEFRVVDMSISRLNMVVTESNETMLRIHSDKIITRPEDDNEYLEMINLCMKSISYIDKWVPEYSLIYNTIRNYK